MYRVIVVLAVLLSTAGLKAGIEVSFQVMAPPLKQGEKLLLLGNFNNWEGDAHELVKLPGVQMYYRSFVLDVQKKDTLAYKFAVRRTDGTLYWEVNPNPANPHHGNRQVVIKKKRKKTSLPPAVFHYDVYFRFPVLLRMDDMQADFRQMRQILEEVHPAIYDYTPKEALDSVFDNACAMIREPAYFRDYVSLLSSVVAQVGCGHSSIWVPAEYWRVSPAGYFPLQLQIGDSLTLVKGHVGNGDLVPPGSRLLSINGLPMHVLVRELESLTSADGMNAAYKRAMVEKRFATKMALRFGYPRLFQVRYIPYGQAHAVSAYIHPVSKAEVDRARAPVRQRSFRMSEQGVGILTLNTFAYYGEVEQFRAFLDSSFRVLRDAGSDRLVLDLRGNSGGDPYCAAALLSYLEDEPVVYFEDRYPHYDTLGGTVPLASLPFKGEFYTLIDGAGFSTTGHFCALLDYHGLGAFVGSELGATFTCTGNAMYPPLDRTRIMLGTAKERRYTAAVEGMDPRRGVQPDYPVRARPYDLSHGVDAVLEYALELARDR